MSIVHEAPFRNERMLACLKKEAGEFKKRIDPSRIFTIMFIGSRAQGSDLGADSGLGIFCDVENFKTYKTLISEIVGSNSRSIVLPYLRKARGTQNTERDFVVSVSSDPEQAPAYTFFFQSGTL